MLVLISLFIFKSEVMKSPFQASNDIRLKTVTIYFRKEENPSTISCCYPGTSDNIYLIFLGS